MNTAAKIEQLLLETMMELVEDMDSQVYAPVVNELKDCKCTYSLGIRKEHYKRTMNIRFQKLNKQLKELIV